MAEESDGGNTAGENERGGRSRTRHRNKNSHTPGNDKKDGKFKGETDELAGIVYDITSDDPSTSYQKTTQKIANYIVRKYPKASEYRKAIMSLDLPVIVEPADLTDTQAQNAFLVQRWNRAMTVYEKQIEQRNHNQNTVFSVILGQCTPAMVDQLETSDTWDEVNTNSDVMALLRLIRSNSHTSAPKKEPSHHLTDLFQQFYGFQQGRLTNSEYFNGFKEKLENLEDAYGPIGQDRKRVDRYLEETLGYSGGREFAPDRLVTDAEEHCRNAYIATNFLIYRDEFPPSG
jgi:hypothetical protein